MTLLLSVTLFAAGALFAAEAGAQHSPTSKSRPADRDGAAMLDRVLRQLVFGAPFDAKIRQRVWASGREVIGVGSYEHAGQGTGRFNLQLTMHDGDGKHTLQQISDGKLAWTRQDVAGHVKLKRVNLGALDDSTRLGDSTRFSSPGHDRKGTEFRAWKELVAGRDDSSDPDVSRNPEERHKADTTRGGRTIDERLLVGGFTELIRQTVRDYRLRLSGGRLEGEPVWIVAGPLSDRACNRILEESGRTDWPDLLPDHVRIAITADPEHESGLGAGIPVRFEFWRRPASDARLTSSTAPASSGPSESSQDHARSSDQADSKAHRSPSDRGATASTSAGQMISLIELYAIRPIDPPPVARFKFVSEDSGVQFVDDTDRYREIARREMARREMATGQEAPDTE